MAGIYFHIPFCKQACHYCDFHFSTSLKYRDEMIDAMQRELNLRKAYLGNEPVETIYFGGGTPSLLAPDEIRRLLGTVTDLFPVYAGAEITLEANPDDLHAGFIAGLRDTPVNRLSVGIQSFFEEDLRWMNRAHGAADAETAIKRLQDAGFDNITADLIYGYPLLTNEKWQRNVAKMLAFNVPHISAYSMTVEPQTALAALIRKGKQRPMDEQQSAVQFEYLMDTLGQAGYIQYEISNFAREGCYARHNSNYWKGVSYLGIGPSAHSFDGGTRQWNVSNNVKYLRALQDDKLPGEREFLTARDRLNEYIMTSLRTVWGLDLRIVEAEFGRERRLALAEALQAFLLSGDVQVREEVATLTRSGKLLADHLASELFFTD
ncbi:radical SAM family heme chaperone HemW [Parapedobacter lycopersici]|uniref:radical SAM family heme chaperone HemW n=1 Tax=Parapedobacter lycopersici TaxID=1864939 RepID=UPI00214D679E|nr:radical SAM family heme chaperone HemW [Parapedobacter lycopersici]